MNSKEALIALQIASYCDSELLKTIESALTQADNKDRVILNICYQDDDLKTLEIIKNIPNAKFVHIPKKYAKGSVFARYLCQQMLENEKYLLQIDAHTRFVKHWDTKLIEELESLNDPKAILSSYPPGYDEREAKLPMDDPHFANPVGGTVMYPLAFKSANLHFIHMTSLIINKDSPLVHQKNPFISGNNFFSYAEAYKEVLFDSEYTFYGDELPMAIRFYTHGWNVYNQKECYVYHQYVSKMREHPFKGDYVLQEEKRFQELLNLDKQNKDLGIYGLGNKRTLEDYEKEFGIDFHKQIIYMNAETGEYQNPEYFHKISYLQQKKIDSFQSILKPKTIEVIIIDKFKEYEKCLESCLNTSSKKNNIKFLIATTSSKEIKNPHIKIFTSLKKINYAKALAYLTKELGNSYVLLIDSSVRFAPGWDEYYTKELDYCGDNSALTSWVFKTNEENHIYKYENQVKELAKFSNSLPVFKYNKEIKISKTKLPYQTGFISDNFLFCKNNILKNIPVDPSLTFEEHQYLYSIRLWTNNINLYYPILSYAMRTRAVSDLKEGLKHKGVVEGLSGLSTYDSRRVKNNYKYDIGNIRPIWTWYDFIKVNYDSERMKIIN